MIRLTLRSIVRLSQVSKQHPIYKKINQTTNLDEFLAVHRQHQDEFNGETYRLCNQKVQKLLNNYHKHLPSQQIKQMTDKFQKLKINQMSEKDLVGILAFLRHFQMKGHSILDLKHIVMKIVKRYNFIVSQGTNNQEKINSLIEDFYEMSYFDSRPNTKIISSKLVKSLTKTFQPQKLSTQQIIHLLKAFKYLTYLSFIETKLRGILAQNLIKIVEQIQIKDLTEIFNLYSQLDQTAFLNSQKVVISKICTRILDNIHLLDQKSILQLLEVDPHSNQQYNRIFKQIHANLLNLIDKNGTILNFNERVFLDIFCKISDKNKFSQVEQKNKKKLFMYLERNLRQKNIQLKNLVYLLKSGYFVENQKLQYFNLMSKYLMTKQINIHLLYQFACQNCPIHTIIIDFQKLNPKDSMEHIWGWIKMGFVIKKYMQQPSYNLNIKKQFDKITYNIELKMNSKQSFTKLYNYLLKYKINMLQFDQTFGDLFAKLPNPYIQQTEKKYEFIYLNYIISGFEAKKAKQFFQKFESKIKNQFLANLMSAKQLKYSTIKRSNLLQLIYIKLPHLLKSFDKILIQKLNFLICSLSSLLVTSKLSHTQSSILWKILYIIIDNLNFLKQLQIQHYFYNTFASYLIKRYGNYQFELPYQQFLISLLHNIQNIQNNNLLKNMITEGLRLNLIKKQHLMKIDLEKISFNIIIKQKLLLIKNQQFIYVANITFGSLQILLSSPLYAKDVEDKFYNIVRLVQQCKNVNYLQKYLILYALPNTKKTKYVLKLILTCFLRQIKSIQTVDVISILKNAIARKIYDLQQYYDILYQTCTFYKEEYKKISLYSHSRIITFMLSQKLSRDQSHFDAYIKKVLQLIYEKQGEQLIKNQIFLKVAKTSYSLNQTQLKYVQNMIKTNIGIALEYFLIIEERLNNSYRLQVANRLANQIEIKFTKNKAISIFKRKLTQTNKQIFLPYYQYFKSKYLYQTNHFNFQSQFKQARIITSISPQCLALYKIIAQSQQKYFNTQYVFGLNQIVVRIQNIVIFHISNKKVGAYEQQKLIKRMLKQKLGQQIKPIGIVAYTSNYLSIIKQIQKNYPGIFSAQTRKKLSQIYNQKNLGNQTNKILKNDV